MVRYLRLEIITGEDTKEPASVRKVELERRTKGVRVKFTYEDGKSIESTARGIAINDLNLYLHIKHYLQGIARHISEFRRLHGLNPYTRIAEWIV